MAQTPESEIMADFCPTDSAHWQTLKHLAETRRELPELLQDAARTSSMQLRCNGLLLDYSKNLVDPDVLSALTALLADSPFSERRAAMFNGGIINVTEERAVLHTALRAPDAELPGIGEQIIAERTRIREVSEALANGDWRGATGEPITDFINIGIGGSDLGPKMVCQALRGYSPTGITPHFISNVDGAEIRHLLTTLDPRTTVIAISSKTFTTQETLLNAQVALDWLAAGLGLDNAAASPHVIAVTAAPDRARAMGIPDDNILRFWDFVGGRYSLWSAIGLSIAVSCGFDAFSGLLAGARAMDEHFRDAPAEANMPILLALLSTWYHNFLGAPTQAVVPYCERLTHLPAFLQQLDMESNGKSVRENGQPVTTSTGAIVWGQTGTNSQHAYFQLLHQGTHRVPVDFVGAAQDPLGDPRQHQVLLANMLAQSSALALGRASEDLHRHYPGNRPSNTLLLDALTPHTLGMLIALYEHKVFTQGVLWGINSFDQFGVELGKQIAGDVLAAMDGAPGAEVLDTSTSSLLGEIARSGRNG